MKDITKYQGIFPAFYACYDAEGGINPEAVRALTRWFIEKGVKGVYVGGSSGECIYQSKEERKVVLENVMAEAKGKLTVIAHVKQTSSPTHYIQRWRHDGAIVFNGPDEQLISVLVMGAVGGIGGTYGAMPELYVKLYKCVKEGRLATALEIQNDCCRIIYKLCSGHGNMYGMIKEVLRKMGCPDCGSVRAPLAELVESDYPIADECVAMIKAAIAKYC